MAFSPDGKTLAAGGLNGVVQLWNFHTGKPRRTLHGHTGLVNSVAFSPGGETLASGGDDGTVRLWDPDTGRPR